MHKKFAYLFLTACTICSRAFALPTIDFTPRPQEYQLEGAKRLLVAFRTANGRVLYSPPWEIQGCADSAFMTVPERQATAEIRRFALTAPLDLQDDDVVKKWVLDHLPANADNISLEEVIRNPVSIDGKPTVEVTISYGLYGLYRRHSLLLCERTENFDTDLIIFELGALPANFEQLHRTFQKSLYSVMGF